MTSETSFKPGPWEFKETLKGHGVTSRINESGLRPLGHAVLVEPYEPEIKKSLLVIPETVQERNTMIETRARIVDIGPAAWIDEPQPRALPGEIVLISKYDGTMVISPRNGKRYRLVNDKAIYCGTEE